MVRELSKHQCASCLIVAFVIVRFASLSCYSSAKTRIRPVNLYQIQMAKKATHSLKPSKAKSITGACTIIMGPACGPCTTSPIVRQTKLRRVLPPMPTLLPLTWWTATQNRSDCRARTKAQFGSG